MFTRGAEIAVVVFDVSRRQTFEHLPDWLARFPVDACAVIVACNKADLASTVDPSEVEDLCALQGIRYFETSAMTGQGVELLFREIAERADEIAAKSRPTAGNARRHSGGGDRAGVLLSFSTPICEF
jgi:signal recognition particle receptor subunit beta